MQQASFAMNPNAAEFSSFAGAQVPTDLYADGPAGTWYAPPTGMQEVARPQQGAYQHTWQGGPHSALGAATSAQDEGMKHPRWAAAAHMRAHSRGRTSIPGRGGPTV